MFRPKHSAQTKFPEDTTEPEKKRMAEPASIVKCRRFCRRTSLHFNRGMQKPVQPVAVEMNFSLPRRCAASEPLSPRAGHGS